MKNIKNINNLINPINEHAIMHAIMQTTIKQSLSPALHHDVSTHRCRRRTAQYTLNHPRHPTSGPPTSAPPQTHHHPQHYSRCDPGASPPPSGCHTAHDLSLKIQNKNRLIHFKKSNKKSNYKQLNKQNKIKAS
jgi:hypothetical protein